MEGFLARRVPHPAYSRDLTPSDFFLVANLNTKLTGRAVQSRQELILTISQIFDEIPKEVVISLYSSCKKM
jgi:hypothetical protein